MSQKTSVLNKEDEKLERVAQERIDRRFNLLKHLFVYVSVNGILLGVDHLLTTRGDWSYIPLFLWGIGLFAHGLSVVFADFFGDWKEKSVEKEFEKMRGK